MARAPCEKCGGKITGRGRKKVCDACKEGKTPEKKGPRLCEQCGFRIKGRGRKKICDMCRDGKQRTATKPEGECDICAEQCGKEMCDTCAGLIEKQKQRMADWSGGSYDWTQEDYDRFRTVFRRTIDRRWEDDLPQFTEE